MERLSAPAIGPDKAGEVAHGLGSGFEVAAQVLGFAVPGFRHKLEQAGTRFTEVGETGMAEFV